MGNPTAPSDLALSYLERSKSRSLRFGSLTNISHKHDKGAKLGHELQLT